MAHSFRRAFFALMLLVGALTASSCRSPLPPTDPNFVVAQGKSWTITRAQLDHEVAQYFKEHSVTPQQVGDANMPILETAILRNMVLEKQLIKRAEGRHFTDLDTMEAKAFSRLKGRFPSDKEFDQKLKESGMTEDDLKKRIHDQVLIEKLFETDALKDTEPSDKEVQDFYSSHQDIFQIPLKLRASRVLILVDPSFTAAQKAEKKKLIDKARARVLKGEDFSKVATEVSNDKYSAPRGGDMNYFQKGENDPQFDAVAFSSKLGVVSPVFETPLGYEFLKVTEIKPAGPLPLSDARPSIAQHLQQVKVAEQKKGYADKVMKEDTVTYNIKLTEMPPETNVPPSPGAVPQGGSSGSGAPLAQPVPQTPQVTNAAPGGP